MIDNLKCKLGIDTKSTKIIRLKNTDTKILYFTGYIENNNKYILIEEGYLIIDNNYLQKDFIYGYIYYFDENKKKYEYINKIPKYYIKNFYIPSNKTININMNFYNISFILHNKSKKFITKMINLS